MENKKKAKLNLVWEWKRNVFPYYLWLFLFQWRYCRFSPPVYAHMLYKNKSADAYLDIRTLNKAAQKILDKVQKSANFLKEWQSFIYKTGKEVHKFCDRLKKINFKKISDKELLDLYQESTKKYINHTDEVAVIRNSNRLLQDKLLEVYGRPKIVSILFSATKESIFLKEQKDLYLLVEKVRKKKIKRNQIDKLLEAHTKKYFYLPCGYADEKPFTFLDFKKRFKLILKSKKSLKDFRKEQSKSIKLREETIKKLKPGAKILRLINFGSACTYFKDFIRGNLNRLQYLNREIFKEIARRTQNKWQDIACLTPDEVCLLLKGKKKIKRRTEALLFSDIKGIHLVLGKEYEKIKKKISDFPSLKPQSELKGIGASPGKVQGEILIVKKIKDAQNKKDFIIVTPMTTPDLVPAVKKAKAIITDEGGLTCHAAIVSREMQKPCIVGTKIATKVFKSGDRVELDANRGIVRKLK